jgi:hypothetical protein
MKARFDAVDTRFKGVDTRFEAAEEVAAARHSALIAIIEKDRAQSSNQHSELLRALDINTRLTKLESRQDSPPAHTLTDVA